jgi:hypothetical protein
MDGFISMLVCHFQSSVLYKRFKFCFLTAVYKAAFGIFVNVLPDTAEFKYLKDVAKYVCLADSITGDGHKLLNVPFDCGFFFIRDPSRLKDIFSIPKTDFAEFAIPPVYFSR